MVESTELRANLTSQLLMRYRQRLSVLSNHLVSSRRTSHQRDSKTKCAESALVKANRDISPVTGVSIGTHEP